MGFMQRQTNMTLRARSGGASKGIVLIIDENLLNLDMASELLEIAGFETVQAEDALTGLKLAREILPDIVLMDLHLPYTDGFTATRMFKDDPKLKAIPIIAFTALAMKEDQERAISSGCICVICKPIDVNTFAQTVEDCLNQANGFSKAQESRQAFPYPQKWGRASKPSSPYPTSSPSIQSPSHPQQGEGISSYKPQKAPERVESSDLAPHKIFVVDDNPMNVELLKDALESIGQYVVPFYSGKDALAAVKDERPDLILLDIMMPDINGYMTLEALKADTETADIPVIFVSALNTTQDMVRGLKLGTYDYITKPFKIEEVKARILASLGIKDLQDIVKSERDKLNTIFQCSTDGIALLKANYDVVSANPVFASWFRLALLPEGRPATRANLFELIGCQCDYLAPCPIHNKNVVLVSSQSSHTDSNQEPLVMETATVTDENGNLRYLNIHAGKVQRYGQTYDGFVVILRDVTKEVMIQKSKETFVATLTHDLKTPIRAEHQALQLLCSEILGPLSHEQREMLHEILQSNRYMAQLVDSLLTTYMYEEGKMELKLEFVDINQLMSEKIIESLRILATEKHIHLALQLPDNPPAVPLDPIEIKRVLFNLVQNAITYTPPEGTITLSVSYDDTALFISVRDTGQGIEPENLKLLFERYKSMAKKFQQVGTGLGLYLSKKIVEAHGGQITVESTLGQGSCFTFSLPLHRSTLLQSQI